MTQPMPQLRISAQPKALFRERYGSELDRRLNRAQRFVHTDDNPGQFAYPTIEIPNEWVSKCQQPLYIRLTLVTVPNDRAPVRCVHPYPIDTEDTNVIKDPATNSLFFPISEEELFNRRKSFQFTQMKMTQYQLKDYGSLRYLNSDRKDDERLEDPNDARKLIEVYQLGQSQLLFSIAEFRDNVQSPIIYDVSSVLSQVMLGLKTKANDEDISFRCSPKRGDWQGGDEILMVIPAVDKRKAFTVRFEHPGIDQTRAITLEFVDSKTVSFYTPRCPVLLTSDNPTISIPIVVTQAGNEIGRVSFIYQSFDSCLSCNSNIFPTSATASSANKRSYSDYENDEFKFDDLFLNPTEKNEPDLSPIRSFISTIRAYSSIKSDDQFSLLNNSIRRGDTNIALKLIEQTNHLLEQHNGDGDTPLLLAVKLNQYKLIEAILKKRPELAKQIDQQKSNLLHQLASLSEDEAKKTIQNILTILDNKTNKNGQTPTSKIAEIHGNNQCSDLAKRKRTLLDDSV